MSFVTWSIMIMNDKNVVNLGYESWYNWDKVLTVLKSDYLYISTHSNLVSVLCYTCMKCWVCTDVKEMCRVPNELAVSGLLKVWERRRRKKGIRGKEGETTKIWRELSMWWESGWCKARGLVGHFCLTISLCYCFKQCFSKWLRSYV